MIEVVVGRIGRPHGIRGEVGIDLRTDEPERRFVVGGIVRIEGSGRDLRIAALRWHGDRLLASFEGVADRTAVEALRGSVLVVDVAEDERPEEDDEYYDRSLVGLRVLDASGADRGVVTEVVHLPFQDLLAIDVAGTERLVPFVTELVPEVDLENGVVRLADVPGLLEDED